MKMYIKSVMVDDQSKALAFYTEKMGFQVKHDIPMGEARWLTVVSPEEPDGVELLLEPSGHKAVAPFKASLYADGLPFTSFSVEDLDQEYERMTGLGVKFTQAPTQAGPVKIAVLDDTCGNLIQLIQLAG